MAQSGQMTGLVKRNALEIDASSVGGGDDRVDERRKAAPAGGQIGAQMGPFVGAHRVELGERAGHRAFDGGRQRLGRLAAVGRPLANVQRLGKAEQIARRQRTLHDASYDYSSVLPAGTRLAVRKTANLHTGGTLEDVTARLHPTLAEAAVSAARALEIPVVGLDLLVPAADQPDYVLIEANERAGLANHEPQPTAERFIDLLFPLSRVHP